MAAKTITLGRDSSNTKVYNKGDISSKHAKITLIGTNEYEVEDLDSTNGTYVNGYRIKKAKISGNDQLRLSMDTIVDVPALFGAKLPFPPMPKKNSPKDFTNEFAQLKEIYDNYKAERAKITIDYNRRTGLVRGVLTSVPMVAIMFIAMGMGQDGEQKIRNSLGMSMMLLMTLGSTLASYFTSDNSKMLAKLDELDENFGIRYVCPNPDCLHQLNGQAWNILHSTGECPKCRAIYNKNKLKNI